jgi:ComF family protein
MSYLDFIAPRSCAFCGARSVGEENSICCACLQDLPWNESPITFPAATFDRIVTMMDYSFPIDFAIKALKFDRKLFYGAALAEVLCQSSEYLPSDIDAVLPVPLHWSRKLRRGFNQAEEIAKPVAKMLAVPVSRPAQRHKATPYQSGLDARERAQNLRHAFTTSTKVRYQQLLIINDVVTTGATIGALARTLLKAGAGKVSVLAVARAAAR